MCGIAGIVGALPLDPQRRDTVRRMTGSLAHRGPDGEGFASLGGCDLGFRRLAIIDVDEPATPFSNEDGSVLSVCNGEIYNADHLRPGLEGRGHRFRSAVDTEVLPHLYEEHGAEMVGHLDGMFAFAVWDDRRKRLLLGRDRAGEKPLFWTETDGSLVFASELRAILAHPGVPRAFDPLALRRYLLHDFFPAPLTPIAAVRKLPAAHLLVHEGGKTTIRRYWDLAGHFTADSDPRSLDDAAECLDDLVSRAVRRRSRSDVPVGVFLSGGVDSAAVLAHLSEQAGSGVPAFALGHRDPDFDESRFARKTAKLFDAEFHALILGETDLDDGLRRVGEGFDEPLGDASTIPTHLLSLHARRHVKVVLSGEGGDELFAGYPTYAGDRVAEVWRRVPASLRGAVLAAARRVVPVSMGNVGVDYLLGRFADSCDLERLERHQSWFGGLSPARHRDVLAPALRAALDGDDPFASTRAVFAGRTFPDALAELLYADFSLYLQDDLLTKVDRAGMLASLETRAPLLDHGLAEYAAGLPSRFKLRRFTTKLVFRKSLQRRLPAEVLHRRKRGFNIPFSRWVLHGLGPQLRERFSEERVAARGIFSAAGIATLLDEHLARRADHRKPLFSLLAYDLWCDRTYGPGAAVLA